MNSIWPILWFALNATAIVVAFGFLQSLACRLNRHWRIFTLGDAILAMLGIRRLNTLLNDILETVPSESVMIDRYLWPSLITALAVLLCIELHSEFTPRVPHERSV